jgi:hypothetical protein
MVVAHTHAIVGEVDRWKNLLDVGHPAPSESKQGRDVPVSTAQDSMQSNNGEFCEHTLTCQQQTNNHQATHSQPRYWHARRLEQRRRTEQSARMSEAPGGASPPVQAATSQAAATVKRRLIQQNINVFDLTSKPTPCQGIFLIIALTIGWTTGQKTQAVQKPCVKKDKKRYSILPSRAKSNDILVPIYSCDMQI